MEQDYFIRGLYQSQGGKPYATPRLLEYGSVAKLTQGNQYSHRYDSNETCRAGENGNSQGNFCNLVTAPNSNPKAPGKRRTK